MAFTSNVDVRLSNLRYIVHRLQGPNETSSTFPLELSFN